MGDNNFVDKYKWEMIQNKDYSIFARDLMDMLWKRHDLQNRCLCLKKAKQIPGRSPRKELTPKKLRILQSTIKLILLYFVSNQF